MTSSGGRMTFQRIAQKMAGDVQTKGREVIDEAKREWDKSGTGSPKA